MAKDREGHFGSNEAQWERAHQFWHLIIDVTSEELSPEHHRELLRTLRIKRAERPAFLVSLPGIVRRGARIDLEPAWIALRKVGIEARLERRTD